MGTSFMPLATTEERMSESVNGQSERAVVTTYVPQYQKEIWEDHAHELGMSQSEFVKTMVQAGRRGFGGCDGDTPDSGGASSGRNPGGSTPEDGAADELESTVLDAIEEEPYLGWDEILDAVVGDVEADLESVLTTLQQENVITHSPRHGGYVVLED